MPQPAQAHERGESKTYPVDSNEPVEKVPAGAEDWLDLEKCRSGEERALDRIVKRHYEAVFSFILRISGDFSLAEDVTQDCFVRLFEKSATLENRGISIRFWLFRVAMNRFRNSIRRRSWEWALFVEEPETGLPQRRTPENCPEAAVLAKEESRSIHQCLQKLKRQERVIFVLRHQHGYEVEDIAAITGMAAYTVRRRLRSAVSKMQTMMRRLGAAVQEGESR